MKRICTVAIFASAVVAGSAASAQGIALFGDARLGLGYNIDNDGGVVVEDGKTPDDLRAVSRVRFGVSMTGETGSGISFGGSIRADNARGGEGGTEGQNEGDVFVSGAWGTLTFGDTNGADEQWVGDVPGDFSLTGLTEVDETRFVSNGGGYGEDSDSFLPNPTARPTVRYDFDYQGFGLSLSTDRDLNAIGVGAGYAADIAGGSWSVGVGYYRFASFETEVEGASATVPAEIEGEPLDVELPTVRLTPVAGGEQWSFGLKATYAAFSFGATYVTVNSQSGRTGDAEASDLLIGASYGFDRVSIGAIYATVLNPTGTLAYLDGDKAYGVTAQYDLGGGATVNGGIVRTYDIPALDRDNATIADFGIAMNF